MIKESTLCLFVLIVFSRSTKQSNNHLGYDSSDTMKVNLHLHKLMVYKKIPRLLGIRYKLTGTKKYRLLADDKISGIWFVDDQPILSSSTSLGFQFQTSGLFIGHTWFESYLDSNLPRTLLANKTLRHEAHLVKVDDAEAKTITDYKVIKYEVEIDTNNILNLKDEVEIEFDKVQYKVYYFKENREFVADFNYQQPSRSSITKLEVKFEGKKKTKLIKSISSCSRGYCHKNDIFLSDISYPVTPYYERIFVAITDDFVRKTQGILTIATESANVMGSKVKVSFDVTGQLFKEKYSTKKFLSVPIILDLLVTKGNGGYTITCRVLGTYMFTHFGIGLSHIYPDGHVDYLTLSSPTYDVYSATNYYTFPDDANSTGTYICSAYNPTNYPRVVLDTKSVHVL